MDINQQLQPIVASLIDNLKGTIEQELHDKISAEVVQSIARAEIGTLVTAQVQEQIKQRLDKFNFVDVSNDQLAKIIAQVTDTVTKTLTASATKQVTEHVTAKLAQFDIKNIVTTIVDNRVAQMVKTQQFPEQSIPHTSINLAGFAISGDQVKGGIIEQFGSVGIEDRSTHIQMTLMDHATAFEGPLWAPSAIIKGDLTVEGTLAINGDVSAESTLFTKLVTAAGEVVKAELNTEMFTGFSNIIFNKIQTEGIDLDRVTQAGKEVVNGNQLGYHIVDTNIQRLGIVRDFQTQGENLLSGTLYVTNGRIGINTMEPSSALAVWDEEVEITASKRSQDRGYLGTVRRQELVLGANSKDNIVLDVEGGTRVKTLTINNVHMSSSKSTPNFEGNQGQIIWSETPELGNPIGWVCLGGARWAKFGRLE
jgi:hypothetical protein